MRASAGEARPKPAALALGVPLIVRVLWRLAETGVERAVIVTGFRAPEVEAAARAGRPPTLQLVFVHNEAWPRPNGESVLTALVFPKQPYENVSLTTDRAVQLQSGSVYTLQSIWNGQAP